MPVMRCELNGRPGYKWGEGGKCYTYRPGDEKGRAEARLKAEMQGRAIKAVQSARS